MTREIKTRIPSGVTITREGDLVVVKGPRGELRRTMRYPQVTIAINPQEVVIATGSARKRIAAMVGTYGAHLANMIRGVTDGFTYSLKVVYSHFPIQLKFQGEVLEINNFLGEKKARYARVEPGIKVTISGDQVTLTGIDRERLGISAANIETATRIRDRDPRVFQDGIYITQRG